LKDVQTKKVSEEAPEVEEAKQTKEKPSILNKISNFLKEL
jgi:phosphoribosyl-ATP pyrophosphohydrolase